MATTERQLVAETASVRRKGWCDVASLENSSGLEKLKGAVEYWR